MAKFEAVQKIENPTEKQLQLREAFKLYCNVVAPGQNVTQTEFVWMFDFCQKRGLDLLAKDVFFVPRVTEGKKIIVPQTSIDGYRKIAASSEDYDGQEVFWCGPDGEWKDVWLSDEPPSAAKVTVYRKGCSKPFPAVAKFSEYVQKNREGKPTRAWQNMGALMIAKCAEALALRKAFPQQLGGIYTNEEMQQADNAKPLRASGENPIPYRVELQEAAPVSEDDEWRNRLFIALTGKGCQFEGDAKAAEKFLKAEHGKGLSELNATECEDILAKVSEYSKGEAL